MPSHCLLRTPIAQSHALMGQLGLFGGATLLKQLSAVSSYKTFITIISNCTVLPSSPFPPTGKKREQGC